MEDPHCHGTARWMDSSHQSPELRTGRPTALQPRLSWDRSGHRQLRDCRVSHEFGTEATPHPSRAQRSVQSIWEVGKSRCERVAVISGKSFLPGGWGRLCPDLPGDHGTSCCVSPSHPLLHLQRAGSLSLSLSRQHGRPGVGPGSDSPSLEVSRHPHLLTPDCHQCTWFLPSQESPAGPGGSHAYLGEVEGLLLPHGVERVPLRGPRAVLAPRVNREAEHVHLHIDAHLPVGQELPRDHLEKPGG